MVRYSFYDSIEYRKKQSVITRQKQAEGLYTHLVKKEERVCLRQGCDQKFVVKCSDPKRYCTRSCSASCTNRVRGSHSEETRQKIAASIKKIFPNGPLLVFRRVRKPDLQKVCENFECSRVFLYPAWDEGRRKYCSNKCRDYKNIRIIGGRPTSPRASRGKAGIRLDISPTIYFYSRWEANIARLYTYLDVTWVYAPTSFDIGGQMYTPDFYLPDYGKYVEVKNFWWRYSKERDEKFREVYSEIQLDVILKPEYLALEKQYSKLIPNWEYKNSPAPLLVLERKEG